MIRRVFAAGLGLAVLFAGSAPAAPLSVPKAEQTQPAPQPPNLVLVPERAIDFSSGQDEGALQDLPDLRQIRLVVNPDRTLTLITSDGQSVKARPKIDEEHRSLTVAFALAQGHNLEIIVTVGAHPPAEVTYVLTTAAGQHLQAKGNLIPEQAHEQTGAPEQVEEKPSAPEETQEQPTAPKHGPEPGHGGKKAPPESSAGY